MSDKNTITVSKLFFAWNDGKVEKWLRDRAMRGWHLEAVKGLGHHFRRGEPADVTYRLDFQSGGGKFDKTEYLGLFRDAGWEYVCRFGAWYYFRTSTGTGKAPEIHTDAASRAAKYQRLLLFLLICSVGFINLVFNPIYLHRSGSIWLVFRLIQAVLLVFWIYAMTRLTLLVARLKKAARGAEKI